MENGKNIKNKKIVIITMIMCFVANCYSIQPRELPELKKAFEKYRLTVQYLFIIRMKMIIWDMI